MYTEHTLDSGIQVILSKLDYTRSASIGFWIKAGSIHETEANNGISHFIEHMLFKGTTKRSAKEIAESFDGIGGDLNAFTSKECTCFHAKVLDKHLPIAIDILVDMLKNSKLTEEDIEKEKNVVIDEILMAEDTPDDVSYDLIAKTVYANGALGRPILGDEETVKSFNRSMIKEFMKQYYNSNKLVISIAGNYNEKEIIDQLNHSFTNTEFEYEVIESSDFHVSSNFIYRDIEQIHLEIAFEGVPYSSKKLLHLAALNNILGASVSSRLFQTIREENGLTYAVNSYIAQYEATGLFSIYANMNKNNLIKVVDLISQELNKIRLHGVTAFELKRVKDQLMGNYILDLEGSDSYMNLLGKGKLFNKKINTPEELEKKINDITLDDIKEMIDLILTKTPSISLVGQVNQDLLDETYHILKETI